MNTIIENQARAWVGCLGCYNSGRLNGRWLDGSVAADLVAAGLAQEITVGDYTAQRCLTCGADEFWVMDHEGFLGLIDGECSPVTAQERAAIIDEIIEAGIDLDAAAAFIEDRGEWDQSSFEDQYVGQYESMEEYAIELAEELYGPEIANAHWPFTCIDWQHAARELSYDYAILGDGYVFRQC